MSVVSWSPLLVVLGLLARVSVSPDCSCPFQGGSVTNIGAFSWDKFSVITFSFLERWQRNFAKNNRYHSAIIRNIPISLMVNIS